MGIYLGSNELGGGAGGGSILEGTKTYRALLIGGGGNGFLGASYGAGGSGGGAFFETALPFLSGIQYSITVGAGGGTTSVETANGVYKAPTGGEGRRVANGQPGANGGGGNSSNSSFRRGGVSEIYDAKGNILGYVSSGYALSSSETIRPLYPQGITLGNPGGYANTGYYSGGGGGAGDIGQSGVANGAGGVGRASDIITVATATSASVGDVTNGSEVYFCRGGHGGRLGSINTTVLGRGPNSGGGGQGSHVSGGVSSGDSGCVIIKVPVDTDFTQTGGTAYTDQGMKAIIWTGTGSFQIN